MTLIWNITYHELDTSWKGHGSIESWKEEQKSWELETGIPITLLRPEAA